MRSIHRIRTGLAMVAVATATIAGLVPANSASAAQAQQGTVISSTGLAPRLVSRTPSDRVGHPATYRVDEGVKVPPYLAYGQTIYVQCWIQGPWWEGPYGWTDKWDVFEPIADEATSVRAVSDAWVFTNGDIGDQVGKCG